MVLTKLLCGLEAQAQLGVATPRIFDEAFLAKIFPAREGKSPFSEASDWILGIQKNGLPEGIPFERALMPVLCQEAGNANKDVVSRFLAKRLMRAIGGAASPWDRAQELFHPLKNRKGNAQCQIPMLSRRREKNAVPV